MKIFVCGGGTGGHFFSGVALAEEFLKYYPNSQVIFVGTKRGIEGRTTLEDQRMKIFFIHARGLKGKNLLWKIMGLLYFCVGLFESLFLLLKERPRFIFGVGGYASAPTLVVALGLRFIMGWFIGILEQNSRPGLVNRLLARWGASAYCPFGAEHFQLVELPIRKSTKERAERAPKSGWPPRTLFILGGSQGARGLNEKLKSILPELIKTHPELRILHQTGTADENFFVDFYRSRGIQAEVFAFSNDLPKYYERADLILSRAGAMTLFEVMAFRRPAILVPYPFAAEDHQYYNAVSVQNGDWIIREEHLNFEKIRSLMEQSQPAYLSQKGGGGRSWFEIFKAAQLK
jgi:UDP-N-acetylglucosamine--N-acetylmuramyl-(pentapeptide) pyrophosphoryl-undecaprenol N-acetylglucosamine transferase